jgi:PTH1 family peptidyl-tRNA hydrolase
VKLVVGLGNPGPRYASTRHNVGFRVVDHFAASRGIALERERFGGRFGRAALAGGLDVGLLQPLTWMNLSGNAVVDALRMLPVGDPSEDLLVVLDDVDLPFGRLRLRPGGGGAGHRGLEHVIACLARSDFPRLRFGIGRPDAPIDTTDWVLTRFSPDEERALADLVPAAADAVEAALVDGMPSAMNRYNRDPGAPAGTPGSR